MVEREREEEEKERQKEQEERKKKAQEMKWRKRLLEAAFEGDDDEINSVLAEVIWSIKFYLVPIKQRIEFVRVCFVIKIV